MEIIEMEQLKEISDGFVLDPVKTESGKDLERMAIFSPINESLVAITKPDFKFIRPYEFVEQVDSCLKESNIPVSNKFISMNDSASKIEISYRTSMTEEVFEGDEVDFGFDLTFDVAKDIKFDVLSWRKVCENGLVSFVPFVKIARDQMVGQDDIMKSISFCINQFRETDLKKFKKMVNKSISRDDAFMEIGNYKMKEEEKDELFSHVETVFGDNSEVSEWELFNAMMFVATHILVNGKALRKKARKTFSAQLICYHGIPHRYMSR